MLEDFVNSGKFWSWSEVWLTWWWLRSEHRNSHTVHNITEIKTVLYWLQLPISLTQFYTKYCLHHLELPLCLRQSLEVGRINFSSPPLTKAITATTTHSVHSVNHVINCPAPKGPQHPNKTTQLIKRITLDIPPHLHWVPVQTDPVYGLFFSSQYQT